MCPSAYDENFGMYSEHLIMLAAISELDQHFKGVLEIGTFDGVTAGILSVLFADAAIDTVDLDYNNPEFIKTYGRGVSAAKFAQEREKVLSSIEKVNFKACNSITLANWNVQYDVIWIDGAHGYPVVAMDVINAYRLCAPGGFVLIDDIWTTGSASDKFYRSTAGFNSLRELVSAGLIDDFHLIPKRLGGKHNLRWTKKYVGCFRKPLINEKLGEKVA